MFAAPPSEMSTRVCTIVRRQGRGEHLRGDSMLPASYAKVPMPYVASASEGALLPRIAVGDEVATRTFIRRYGPLVLALARRHACNDPEDAVQDIFLELWRLAGRFDAALAQESTFVTMVARRRLIDRKRAQLRKPTESVEGEDDFDLHEAADDESHTPLQEARSDAQRAAHVLATLPSVQQEAIRLSVLEDAPHAEIADTLDLPLGTVKSYIRRGLARVHAVLVERGG